MTSSPVIHPDGLPLPQRYWSMTAIGLGISVTVIDGSVANIALPTIARELSVAPAASVWVVNAYQLVILASLLPVAALGERLGYRRVYITGLAVFTIGSLGCALSHSLAALVASRIVQGLGASGIMAVNGALVRFTYPARMLGRGVGLNATVVSLAAALSPTVASAILAVGSWEWLFAVNVPIGAVGFLVARALPFSDLAEHAFDWRAASLNALALGLFFTGADAFAHGGSLAAAGLVAAAAAIAAVLVRRERGSEHPLIPIDLLRNPVFALSVMTSVCSFAAYMLAFLALPFAFETVLHRSQVSAGLLMTPWSAALAMVAPIAGRLSDRVSAAVLGTAGLTALTVGLLCLAALPADASTPDIAWRMALCGCGFALFQAPNNRTLLSSAPRRRVGAAGGMLATARLLGQSGGATLTALMFALAPRVAETADLLIGAAVAALAATCSLLRLRHGPPAVAAAGPAAS